MRLALLALATLTVAACGQRDAPAPSGDRVADTVLPADAAPSKAKAESVRAFTCEKDLPITAIHGTNAAGERDVAIVVRGQSFNLLSTVSASGARYASADGLEPGMGIIWWEKGDTAILQQVPSDRIDDPAAAQTIRTCTIKAEQQAKG